MILTILIFIAVLFVLVMVHEAGHFSACRKFGVKVDEFGFGIPPRVLGWRKRDDGKREMIAGNKEIDVQKNTLFSLNWLPIGGFVKIKGENEEVQDPDSFSSQSAWKRVVILSSGVLGNIVLACVTFILLFAVGSETYLPEGVNLKSAQISNQAIKIVSVAKGSPAETNGLQAGDTLVSLDGIRFENVAVVREYIQEHQDRAIQVQFARNGDEFQKQIQPARFEGSGDRALLGINMAQSAFIRYSVPSAILKGFEATFVSLYQILKGIVTLLSRAISGQPISADIAGPVGIAVMTGQAARLGIVYIMQFMALLSLNLAIINIFPFPALDGGRIFFIMLEKIRRKKMRAHVEQWANTIGFSLLLLLILWVTIGDVTKLQVVKDLVEGVKNIF